MTAPTTPTAVAPTQSSLTPGSAAVAALGCGALAARPALVAATAHPFELLVLLFGVLLVVGLALPIPRVAPHLHDATRRAPLAVLMGIVAFGSGRVLVNGHAPAHATTAVILANLLAAVAEEVWFRRLCYGLLAPAGPVVAVAGSTVLFALVHVSIYGFWILPLDLAAGAVLGWQRAVTGSCVSPAITHMVANLLVLL
jgi:hypothetical protein